MWCSTGLRQRASDEWAVGNAGYLKQANVIAMFEAAGFELVAESEINANPLDKPGAKDVVWRLPPSLRGSEKNPEQTGRHGSYRRIGPDDPAVQESFMI